MNNWKERRVNGPYVDSLTEYSSMVLLAANIIEKTTKIAVFIGMEASTPLYEEKTTTVG